MIKIVYVTDTLMAGGVERQLTELVTRLDRTRYEPHVICLYAERAGRSLYFRERLLSADIPVYVMDIGWSPQDKVGAIFKILRLIWQLRPDIVQPMNYHSNLLTRMACLLMPPMTALIGTLRTASTQKQLFYERISWFFCRTIVCNSLHLVEQLTSIAQVPPTHVRYIPNGVDVDYFSQLPPTEVIATIRQDAQQLFVTIGRISEQKSHHLLVEAFGLLKVHHELPHGVKLIIVGELEKSAIQYQELIDKTLDHYALHDVVSVHPQTSHPEHYYQASDVMILASLWEGLPNVALESLAAGKPLIISDAANAGGIIQHGTQGWVVTAKNVPQLAEMLLKALHQSPSERQQMQAAAYQRALEFDMTSMVRHYQTLYDVLTAIPNP